MKRLRVLTWHVHGNYLHYLSHAPHDFFVAALPGDPPGYAGLGGDLPWRDNLHAVAADALHEREFDLVLYQHAHHWQYDRLQRLSEAQRALPAVFLEHDPPQQHPSDTRHPAADSAHVVHVTPFNALMWDNGAAPVSVIQHGVALPAATRWTGELDGGIVVVNHLARRGRRLGADVFERVRREVPLLLAGMDSAALGGAGEVPNSQLAATMAQHRFFFNPIRWTSLGLAVIEAMHVGLPIVGLATTELPSVIDNGVNGFVHNDVDALIDVMQRLRREPGTARDWGEAARATASRRFGIERFAAEWDGVLTRLAA